MDNYICSICKIELDATTAYEYRGRISCYEHFYEAEQRVNLDRQDIINEERSKTEVFRGLDLSDSIIGKANKKLLKRQREIASKESYRIKLYEKRT